jgi:hypothetical protein
MHKAMHREDQHEHHTRSDTRPDPQDIAKIVITPKSYADDDIIYPAFKWLRENMPLGVAEVEGYDPIWVVTKHADIKAIELNAKLFHNADHNRFSTTGLRMNS